MPLVSFCISTFQRPQILSNQLKSLLSQTYPDFEIVVSDNDPAQSAKDICYSLNDYRLKYYANEDNIGMIKSFNKSIERANTPYVIMITDDDSLDKDFLREMIPLIMKYPQSSLYCGFKLKNKNDDFTEILDKKQFPYFVLHPKINPTIFWSNCILKKDDVANIGLIPDYGSPHLADHALLCSVGSINGGVIKNKIYSFHNLHETNYSKGNFDSYYLGCIGFYNFLSNFFSKTDIENKMQKVISLHLKQWFISMSFSLRRHFYKLGDGKKIEEIDAYSQKILRIKFMKKYSLIYQTKKIIFYIKATLGLIN